MALVVKDRVRVSSTTAGTGALTLGAAITGFQDFSVIGNGNTTYYAIVDPSAGDYEIGIGTYSTTGPTLTRTTILESSNAGSAVNFSTNPKDVFVTYPAERSVYVDGTAITPATAARLGFANLTQGSALSVLGVTGNATANVDSVAAVSDHQVLRRSGTALAFGAVALDQTNAVAGTLPVVRGGTGVTTSTGSGSVVLSTSPSLVTPALGTPSSGNLANCTFPTLNQNTTGNAATATALQTARTIGGVSFNGTANINLPGVNIAGNQSTTGNAATATIFQTARTINGVSFNGSANIVVESYIEDDNATNATRYLTFVDNTTAAYKRLNEDSNLTYNPATNVLTTGTFSGALSGNATTATTLQTARTINGVSFNGSANITITSSTPNTLTRGTYLTGANFNGSAAATWAVDATTTNTASKVVARDASGNFSAGTITASLSGNATSATSATSATNATNATNAVNVTGTVASGVTGTTQAVTTNNTSIATTAFVNAEIANDAPTKTGGGASGTWGISITGNSATSTILQTARTINGTSFNGSANITTANWGTARTLWGQSVNGSANITAPLLPAAGSVSAPAFSTSADTNTGMFFPAADTLAFAEGGVEVIRVNSSSNVGVGTTTPGEKLDVNGSTRAKQLIASNGIVVNSTSVSENYTIPTGSNAMSAGPITVNSGITVTISTGSVWTVV